MTNNDLKKLSQMMDEKLAKSEDKIMARMDEKLAKSEDKIMARMDEKLANTEERILRNMDDKLVKSESRVMGEIGKFMSEQLIPLIEEKADKSDIDRLESKLDKVIDSSIDHERRIQAIERIPSIAHQIRR